jgi:hypothetical protein
LTNYAALVSKSTGDILTAANYTAIKDDLDALAKPVRGQATNASAQSVGNVSAATLTLNSAGFLSGLTLSSNALVVPSGAGGIYDVTASMQWATNTTGDRQLIIRRSGIDQVKASVRACAGGEVTGLFAVHQLVLVAGDTVTIAGWQSSGGSLSTVAATVYLTVIMRSWT